MQVRSVGMSTPPRPSFVKYKDLAMPPNVLTSLYQIGVFTVCESLSKGLLA